MAGAELADVTGKLERLLRLRSFPFAMKLFERPEDMEAIARIRRPRRFTRSTRSWARPLPQYRVQQVARAGLAVSYSDKK